MYGTTLVIANPQARNGKAAQAAAEAHTALRILHEKHPDTIGPVSIRYTVAPGDATNIVREEGAHCDSVFVLGGDGVVNETVNGLMALPTPQRPRLGVIPCGNGDDFARSLSLPRDVRRMLEIIRTYHLEPWPIDLGQVNGRWFDETLSFGLDAAVALSTADLRQATGRSGALLYAQSAIEQATRHRDVRRMRVSIDGGTPQELDIYLFAVQNGPSYGGGYRICPNSRLADGVLSLCYAKPPISALGAGRLFLKAKRGTHVNDPHLTFLTARRLTLECSLDTPVQIDGERLQAERYDIAISPGALDAYFLV